MLPSGCKSVGDLQGKWWVAHTKPRCEKTLAFDLLTNSVGYYLPMCRKDYVSGGRKRSSLIPAFPSYVFVCGDEADRLRALESGQIVRPIPVANQAEFVEELRSIETALLVRPSLDVYPFAVVGKRCRVRSGPLIGIEGRVIRRDNRQILVLAVTLLGSGVALEIDPALLEPVSE
ncbi:transcription termination/antitermination protein NusG [Humisphaera borealis]|uniref:NusG-like N-terminal domain-containing protein n=1 Tax=Humisphaera borealis TaxID=2807512 RepID=A0A7M2WYU8_9BACT|nr:transcription termination/antitermination NusG family protein [Humisphaera borealis]QOV90646.1 hypothetical protein IPV69_04595 [Humisphaera borealis]